MTPRLTVNGEQRPVVDIEPHVTALDWLRDQGLTGAKEGCAEGECGACSIMVSRPDGDGRTRWTALNACLVPVLALDGQELVTAEGLGKPGALHPVQKEMAHRGGSQCGYCTPGFICSMAAEYYRPDRVAADRSAIPVRAGGSGRGRPRPGRAIASTPTPFSISASWPPSRIRARWSGATKSTSTTSLLRTAASGTSTSEVVRS